MRRWGAGGSSDTIGGVESFAELLRRHRGARSLTQGELAERARLTAKAVGALERGERRHPYPHTVRSLADALELDPEERSTLVSATSRRAGTGDRTAPRPVTPSSLLIAVGPVIGRDDEVEALVAVLRRPFRRVVTLTGPGGVGKTTLALTVAGRVRPESPGGVIVVELAEVVDPDEVLPAVATALGVVVADQRVTPGMLAPALAGRRTLLLLDNLERVLDVAPALAQLVTLCPDLVVLATSRAPLGSGPSTRRGSARCLTGPPSSCSTITPRRPGLSSMTTRTRPWQWKQSVPVPTGCRWPSSWPLQQRP